MKKQKKKPVTILPAAVKIRPLTPLPSQESKEDLFTCVIEGNKIIVRF